MRTPPKRQLLMTDPNAFYQAARHKFDTDPIFTERARSRLVRLQAGDPATLAIWQRASSISPGSTCTRSTHGSA